MVDGVVRTADPEGAQILHKELLPADNRIPDDATLKKILAHDLDAVLKNMSPLYWNALNGTDQKDDGFQKSIPKCLLGTFKHSEWNGFRSCYADAENQIKTGQHGFLPLRVALGDKFQGSLIGGGALQVPDAHPGSDSLLGQLTFFIVAPKSRWSASLPNTPEVLLHDQLAEYLDTFDQGIWRQEYIKQLIDDFYSRRGLSPYVQVSPSKKYSGKPLSITIQPNAKIAVVNMLPPARSPADTQAQLDRSIALYNLVSTSRFRTLTNIQPHTVESPAGNYDSIDVPDNLQPLFNSIPFAAAQADLAARGFTVTEGSSLNSTVPTIFVNVHRNDPDSKAGKETGTLPVKPGTAAVPSARNSLPTTSFFRNADTNTASADETSKASPKDKKGYVGAGFSYLSGQGVRPIGAFEYQRLLGVADITLESGSANYLANGSGSASFDYLGFQKLHHRLSLDLNGGSDTTYHRLIGIRLLNERRNGGTAHAQFEVLRDPLGSSLRFYVDSGAQTVTLTDPELSGPAATVISDTLVSTDVGATYVLSSLQSARPFQLQINPTVRAATAANGGFAKGSLTTTYHQEALGTSVFEVKAQFSAATDLVPVYELPSFGGVSSLRGFRADDLLARRVWTVQPELWHGLPRHAGSEDAVAQFLNNNVRLAVFCDFGGAYQTYAGPPGVKAGPGIGLRALYHQVTFRLDWAYGLGTVATGSGHGRAYFSVSTPIR
ncbi:MAG: BamA/TamA family outer membrane protein [Silvibacterium sp.]|nr:BamA/TamA family outer membrane protein [Silvibacterium sp.]